MCVCARARARVCVCVCVRARTQSSCKLAFCKHVLSYLYAVYNIHIPFVSKRRRRQGLSAARIRIETIDRRRDTNPRAPSIIYEPRHLSQYKPRDGGRIPAVRFRKISTCKRNLQVRIYQIIQRISVSARISVTERIFRRCSVSD